MKWRFFFVFFLFFFLFFIIWGKLFYWQVVRAADLATLGREQYAQYLEIPPKRGDIKTSDGFPLVTNKLSYLVYENPKEVKDKDAVVSLLADKLQLDVASVSSELVLDRVWVPIKINIDVSVKQMLEKLNIPGIGFTETATRFYPESSMAAQLVGFVGKDDQGADKGYFGLEGFYDRQLKGRIGQAVVVHDAFGKPVLAKLTQNSGQQDGRSLVLHIDRIIQFLLEEKLKKAVEAYGAKSGMAAVMDPKTGAVLAMTSFPSFNPSTYWDFQGNLYRNPFVSDTYEPGSTFKPLIMSAALDSGVITPETQCTICSGPVTIGDYTLHTWNDKYYPQTNMIDVIMHSDNTGMVFVSQKLGFSRMLSYMREFGIGDTTGIDVQGEVAPDIKESDTWYPIDVATASFGQGISVTPIELLDAFSAIANGGIRMEPHIVSQIQTSDGQTITITPKQLDQVVSAKAAKVMTEILVNAVNKGEASFAKLKGYRIAGKTGTASIPVAGHYDPSKTIASFIGFAPADNPKFSMLVIFNQPSTSIYGAETAAPVFFDMARDILAHYNIAPTEE